MQLEPAKIRQYRRKHKLLGSRVAKNPIQTLGLDLPFLIVTTIGLRAAAAISLAFFFIHLGTMIAAMIFCRLLPRWGRPIVYVGISTSIMLLVGGLLARLFPGQTVELGMYIYLLAVNAMTLGTAVKVEKGDKIYPVMVKVFRGAAGFTAAMFVISLFREYMATGSLWGVTIPHILRMEGLLVPFFGFILVGFLLAGTRFLGKRLMAVAISEDARREAEFKIIDS